MAFIKATLLIAALQAGVLIKSLRFVICVLVALVPAGIALAAGGMVDAPKLALVLGLMALQVAAPLVGLILGSVVIAEEVEGRTITFFFTRPIHRSALFMGRWIAVALMGGLLLAVSAAGIAYGSSHATFRNTQPQIQWELQTERATGWKKRKSDTSKYAWYTDEEGLSHRQRVSGMQPGGVIELPASQHGRPQRILAVKLIPRDMDLLPDFAGLLILAASLGAAFYTMITAGLSIFFKRPMILGLAYAFAIEGLLANLPGSTQALSVQYYLRSLLVNMEDPAWSSFLGKAEFLEPSQALLRLSVFAIVLLGGCSFAVVRKQFVLTS